MRIDERFNCVINILSKKHKITIDKKIKLEQAPSAIGYYEFSDHSIHLKKGLKIDVAEETLFHEIIHAIETDLYLGFSERKVSIFSAVLYDTLKRNNLLSPLFYTMLEKVVEKKMKQIELPEGFSLKD